MIGTRPSARNASSVPSRYGEGISRIDFRGGARGQRGGADVGPHQPPLRSDLGHDVLAADERAALIEVGRAPDDAPLRRPRLEVLEERGEPDLPLARDEIVELRCGAKKVGDRPVRVVDARSPGDHDRRGRPGPDQPRDAPRKVEVPVGDAEPQHVGRHGFDCLHEPVGIPKQLDGDPLHLPLGRRGDIADPERHRIGRRVRILRPPEMEQIRENDTHHAVSLYRKACHCTCNRPEVRDMTRPWRSIVIASGGHHRRWRIKAGRATGESAARTAAHP